MKTCAQYIAEAKTSIGDPKMSDRVLGETLGGYTQSTINKAKTGNMPDSIAIKLALELGVPPGEVLMVARLERERDPAVKAHLVEWAGKIFGLLPSDDTRPAIPAGGVLVAGQDVSDVDASIFKRRRQKPKSPTDSRRLGLTGGEGGIRTHGTLRYA
jgi:hypothetical protein